MPAINQENRRTRIKKKLKCYRFNTRTLDIIQKVADISYKGNHTMAIEEMIYWFDKITKEGGISKWDS